MIANDSSDPSKWSNEQLSIFLTQYGFTVEDVNRKERIALACSLIDSMGDSAILPASPAMADAPPAIDRGDAILSLKEITGCNDADAIDFLNFFDWNVDNAISVFLETGSVNLPSQSIQSTNSPIQPSSSSTSTSMPAMPIPIPNRNNNNNSSATIPPQSPWRHQGSGGEAFESDDEDDDDMGGYGGIGGQGYRGQNVRHQSNSWGSGYGTSPTDEYDEDGIRRPDSVKNIRLLENSRARDPTARADDPSVEWMFPPPHHISFPGQFMEAREMAKQERKWLLVNLQSHTEFASHMLNRDTWSNEIIEGMLRDNFVFWQRGHTSDDGKSYMNMYKVDDGDLPHVAIIDSRTGAKLVNMKGYIEPDNMCISLVEFLQDNSFDKMKAPKERNIDATQSNSLENLATSAERHHYLRAADTMITSSSISDIDIAVGNGKSSSSMTVEETFDRGMGSSNNDYGPLVDEPAAGEENTCKINVKFPSGKSEVRRFKKSDPVRALYAFAKTKMESDKAFDLHTTYNARSYGESLDSTIEEQQLGGCQVVARYK